MHCTAQEIEDLITRIEHGDSKAIDEAKCLMNYAASDDWKDRLADSLFSLEKAVECFSRGDALTTLEATNAEKEKWIVELKEERDKLRKAYRRLKALVQEGGAHGRPMDLFLRRVGIGILRQMPHSAKTKRRTKRCQYREK